MPVQLSQWEVFAAALHEWTGELRVSKREVERRLKDRDAWFTRKRVRRLFAGAAPPDDFARLLVISDVLGVAVEQVAELAYLDRGYRGMSSSGPFVAAIQEFRGEREEIEGFTPAEVRLLAALSELRTTLPEGDRAEEPARLLADLLEPYRPNKKDSVAPLIFALLQEISRTRQPLFEAHTVAVVQAARGAVAAATLGFLAGVNAMERDPEGASHLATDIARGL